MIAALPFLPISAEDGLRKLLIILAPVANRCDGEYWCYSALVGGIPPFFKWDNICENLLLLPGVAPVLAAWIGERF